MGFALHFLPLLVLPSFTRRPRTKMWEVTCVLKARFWMDKFSNYGFMWFRSTFRNQALQRVMLGNAVYGNMTLVWLQFT